MSLDADFLNQAVSRIYDCAIEPDGWEATLDFIRDRLDLAFLAIHFVSFPQAGTSAPPQLLTLRTDWDEGRMVELLGKLETIPGFQDMRSAPIDSPVVQLRLVDEQQFRRTDFYRTWVGPQGLKDACNTPVIQRRNLTAMLSAWTSADRPPVTDTEMEVMSMLTPHIRRALLISDMLDDAHVLLRIHRGVLDRLTVAIFIVGASGRLVYHNAAGEALLSRGNFIQAVAGNLRPLSETHRSSFVTAVDIACSGIDSNLGTWGAGMALPGSDGEACVVNVLPFGMSDRRRALGPGMAAIFVTGSGAARPPSVEVLSALTGLTSAEAEIALGVAEGESVDTIARRRGISINTVRKHLSNAFNKTGAAGQNELGALVNRLRVSLDTGEHG